MVFLYCDNGWLIVANHARRLVTELLGELPSSGALRLMVGFDLIGLYLGMRTYREYDVVCADGTSDDVWTDNRTRSEPE